MGIVDDRTREATGAGEVVAASVVVMVLQDGCEGGDLEVAVVDADRIGSDQRLQASHLDARLVLFYFQDDGLFDERVDEQLRRGGTDMLGSVRAGDELVAAVLRESEKHLLESVVFLLHHLLRWMEKRND